MSNREIFLSAALVAAFLSPVVPAVAGAVQQDAPQASSPQQTLPPPDPAQQEAAKKALPPGDGRDEVVRICSGCHLLTVVSTQRKTEDAWTDTVIEMRNRGANGSDDEMEKIVGYLAKNFSPNSAPAAAKVNVNTASAADVASGLGVSQEQAQAIVDYREKNGKFKDIDGLKKVSGVDADKIDAAKDRIEF